jgi:UDP-hydrolysing UDP-N-acetyl-D-glucosamine 2-epimerase
MIGDGWDNDPSVRPGPPVETAPGVRRIAVVTGSRAEFGLLAPVMRAVKAHKGLELAVVAAGSHLVEPALTYKEVKAEFGAAVADAVPMQIAGKTGRWADVESLGRGVSRFGRSFERLAPDWVVVLGDRIEVLAAASAASVGGLAVAHIHGGDRAEGVADEAMRHAVTKLAHFHLAATQQSAARIVRMGERPEHVLVVGSPAIDGLAAIPTLSEREDEELGRPDVVFLMHPVGRADEREEGAAAAALEGVASAWPGARVLALHPNLDAGRAGVLRAVEAAAVGDPGRFRVLPHLPRARFVGLLRRVAERGGVLVGNSSAALIEAAALKVPAVDIGPRQAGRERAGNVVAAQGESAEAVAAGVVAARRIDRGAIVHPYGAGEAGARIAAVLAAVNPHDPGLLRKRNAY